MLQYLLVKRPRPTYIFVLNKNLSEITRWTVKIACIATWMRGRTTKRKIYLFAVSLLCVEKIHKMRCAMFRAMSGVYMCTEHRRIIFFLNIYCYLQCTHLVMRSHFSHWLLSPQFAFSHRDPKPSSNRARNNLYNRPGIISNTFSNHLSPMKSPSAFGASPFEIEASSFSTCCHSQNILKCSKNPGVKTKTRKYRVKIQKKC